MFQLRFDLAKLKTLLIVFYLTFFAVHFLVIYILGDNLSLAPDEQGYLKVFQEIYSKPLKGVQDDTGWDGASDLFLWTVNLPAKFLTLFGLSDLAAIRTQSVGITFLTILVLVHSSAHFDALKVHLNAIMLFSIPSIFVWTSLGMREAFIFFFMGLFFWSLNIITCKNRKTTGLEIVVLAIASLGMLSTKNYLWAVLVFSLFLVTFWKLTKREIFFKHVAIIFLPIILSILFYNFTSKNDALGFITSLNSSSLESVSTRIPISGIELSTSEQDLIHSKKVNKQDLIHSKKVNKEESVFLPVKTFLMNISANKEDLSGEKSGIQAKSYSDNYSAASISEPISFITASLRFIVSPLVFRLDVPVFILVASAESLVWIGLTLLLLVRVLKRIFSRTCSSFAQAFAIVVLLMFIIMSAGVEINLGTAFRHRAILLIPTAFLLLGMGTKKSKSVVN